MQQLTASQQAQGDDCPLARYLIVVKARVEGSVFSEEFVKVIQHMDADGEENYQRASNAN